MDITKAFPVCNVEVSLRNGEGPPETYAAVHAEGKILIVEANRADLAGEPPEAGTDVTVRSMLQDAAYIMQAKVTHCLTGNLVTLAVAQEGEIERIQRRKHFRVEMAVPVTIENGAEGVPPPVALKTEDISGGGCRLLYDQEIAAGTIVKLKIDVGDGKPLIACQAEIVRCFPAVGGGFQVCARFLNLDDSANDRLVSVLTRELRNKMNL